MSRQVIDTVIVAALLALAATHLYAQGTAGRKVIRPSQVAAEMSAGAQCVGVGTTDEHR